MRLGLAAAFMLLACACSPMADNRSNKIAELLLPVDYDPLAPLSVDLALRDGICRASVSGEAVDSERLLARALVFLKDSIDVQEAQYRAVDRLPSVALRSAPDVPWRCIAGAIYQVRRVGFGKLSFGPTADGGTIGFDLPSLDEVSPPIPEVNLIAIAANGRLQWNGGSVSGDQLSEYLRAAAAQRPDPGLAIEPAAQTRLDAVLAVLARARAAGVMLELKEGWLGSTSVGFVELERYARELK